MKKYYTDWRTILTYGTIVGILFGVTLYWNRNPELSIQVAINAVSAWFIFWGFILLISTKYSYAAISGSTLKFVYILFIRRTIDISSITEINDQSTYKVAKGAFRSLYIFYKDKKNNTKYIELRITIFPEKTLGKLIKNLKEVNPKIELNRYAEKLLQGAKDFK